MIIRFFIAISFVLLTSAQAWACSCPPTEGNVSELLKNYISFWGVPTHATVNIENLDSPRGGITYTFDILQGYDRISQTKLNAYSHIEDGGSCGRQLIMGLPQFISVYDYGDEVYTVSACTPLIPYDAVRHYLETGDESFIPEWRKCHRWSENDYDTSIFNTELEACKIWKNADHIHGFMGAKDRRKYDKIWWNKIQSAEPKKKRRWWHFKKD